MLVSLRVKDFAIIDELNLELGPGLNILTGETGAGKSILIDALGLALGGRASTEMIRSPADQAEIEVLFDIRDLAKARTMLLKNDLGQGAELIVRRVVSASGRSRAYINGCMVTGAALFDLGRTLVDIYGQHEHQSLLNPEHHLPLLDSFAGSEPLLSSYAELYKNFQELLAERDRLSRAEAGIREREDFLKFRIGEIERMSLRPSEEEELGQEREILKHAELLRGICAGGAEVLYDQDGSVLDRIHGVMAEVSAAVEHDQSFRSLHEQLEAAAAQIEDVAGQLKKYGQGLNADPARLDEVEDRLNDLKTWKRKYAPTLEGILELQRQSAKELASIEHREERLKEVTKELEQAGEKALTLAGKMSEMRKAAARELAAKVAAELKSLDMPKTRFAAEITSPGEGLNALGPLGIDRVEFLLSPNPGEELKPLIKIASGGELSRIMLVLRGLLSRANEPGTLVLDEVDAGIGGATAEAVGRRMKELSRAQQVLCVTHLPQIACYADFHYKVSKAQSGKRTVTRVQSLAASERIEEIARMLGGIKITGTTRAHAEEMIKGANAILRGQGSASGVRGQ